MPLKSSYKRWMLQGLRILFKLLYHQLAWAYDAIAWIVSFGMWKSWVFSVLPYIHGKNVLEIGHGPGHLLLKLRRAGYTVIGLDESKDMGRVVVRGMLSVGLDVLCVNGYAQFMPFQSNYFETACATFPSEYIFDTQTLSEIYRVLVPGGRLVILPTARFDDAFFPGRFVARLFSIIGQQAQSDDGYTKLLVASGFLVSTQIHPLAHSSTMIIIAIKPQTA